MIGIAQISTEYVNKEFIYNIKIMSKDASSFLRKNYLAYYLFKKFIKTDLRFNDFFK